MVKNGWYYHKCGQKIFKVLPETVLLNHVTYCKRCKTEQKVSIYCGKEIEVKEIQERTFLHPKTHRYWQVWIENINRYVQKCNGKPIRTDFQKDSISAYCKKFYMQEHNLNRIQEVVR